MKISGFTLIEVLVALAIISLVLLGMVSLQNTALAQTYSAYLHSVAESQAENALERFRAIRSAVGRQQEFDDWLQEIPQFLPQGYGDYQCALSGQCSVRVFWQDHGLQTVSLSTFIL